MDLRQKRLLTITSEKYAPVKHERASVSDGTGYGEKVVWVDLNAWSKMTEKTNEGDERCTTHKFEGICIHRE